MIVINKLQLTADSGYQFRDLNHGPGSCHSCLPLLHCRMEGCCGLYCSDPQDMADKIFPRHQTNGIAA